MESNKLIAEFMGVKPTILGDEITYEMYGAIDCIEDGVDEQHFFLEEQLLFHTSWDWLMPVVEKIENFIFDENNSYNVTIGSTNYCVIQDSNGDTIEIIKDNGKSKLETTYQAVVEFINQHNKTI